MEIAGQYTLTNQELGRGSFATVFKGIDKVSIRAGFLGALMRTLSYGRSHASFMILCQLGSFVSQIAVTMTLTSSIPILDSNARSWSIPTEDLSPCGHQSH